MAHFIFGIHAALSQLEKKSDIVIEALLQDNYEKNRKLISIFQLANQRGVKISIVKKKQLDDLVKQANHQGVVLQIKSCQKRYSENDLDGLLDRIVGNPLLLILDQIQDPHNLGACLRTALAAGVDVVIAPKDGAASITPVVQKVACGATETLPYVQVTNLVRTMKHIQQRGIWITGTSLHTSEYLYETDFTGPVALVIGSEGGGMRRLVSENCDYLVKIPMPGKMESLNASVATGVCLFEAVRQRFLAEN
ncbi:MAG TPA: 23S rRNA (guanosine(2251)-2'-O)-methyltransferase RlmB [Gammaproteobacteria bacterium]|nr:23S rRNA (guanosine(2251)-2'-O)-methyltransferase RlmB [Gammaproteobacteria bacterium]